MSYFISIELRFLRNDLLSNELNTQQICKYSYNIKEMRVSNVQNFNYED